MKKFVIPGDQSHLAQIDAFLNDTVCGVLLHQRTAVEKLELTQTAASRTAGRIFTLQSLINFARSELDDSDRNQYVRLLEYILADPRVHYMAQRSRIDSAFNNAVFIETIALNSMLIIRQTDPGCLISSSTPHSVEAWVFAKCFEFLGLPVFILESTPIAFRAWICRGIDDQEIVPLQRADGEQTLSLATARLLRDQRESSPGTRDGDGYHHSRIYLNSVAGADSNQWWSVRRELRWLFSGKIVSSPLRLHASLRKRHLYRSYRRVAVEEIPAGPFVVFFMHYQPERSSLPVGLFYSQQWLALRMLAWSLPKGWKLLVREHPTTWLKPLDVSVRTRSLYTDIAALKNVDVCSMDVDTFDLIDNCRAVATLTGSVGFQSLLRSKPVIAFGLAPYKDHAACYRVASYEDLARAFDAIQAAEFNQHLEDDAIRAYLHWIERNSFGVDSGETDWRVARLKNFAEIYRQVLSEELLLS